MADEKNRGSEGGRREGVKILPGEWRRRLAERRARDSAPAAAARPAGRRTRTPSAPPPTAPGRR